MSDFLVIEYFRRMAHDHSQLGHVPLEHFLENHPTDTNIDQLLTLGVVTTDQSSSEVVTTATAAVANATRQVPNGTAPTTLTTRQLARRRQNQRRRQRQRDRQQDVAHQQHQRQRRNWMPMSPPHRRYHTDNTPEQRISSRLEDIIWNPLRDRDPRQEPMESPTDEALLDAYDLEKIDPRCTWEQEQLYAFEGLVVLEHLQLLSDETEQQENIDAEERLEQAKEEERREQQLLQLEQGYQIDFLLLQMNQPLVYDG
jgi:hypothetical protein